MPNNKSERSNIILSVTILGKIAPEIQDPNSTKSSQIPNADIITRFLSTIPKITHIISNQYADSNRLHLIIQIKT